MKPIPFRWPKRAENGSSSFERQSENAAFVKVDNARHQSVKVALLKVRPFSEWRVIRPESGSLGYSAHLKRSVSESAVLQQSSRPPAILIDTSTLPSLDSSNERMASTSSILRKWP